MKTSKSQIVVQGLIQQKEWRQNYFATWIGDTVLNDDFMSLIANKVVTVRYYISDVPKTKQELRENQLLKISGSVDADYRDRYTEVTGYLWTDEKLKVGGHDLLSEISDNEGKYIYLEINIHLAALN